MDDIHKRLSSVTDGHDRCIHVQMQLSTLTHLLHCARIGGMDEGVIDVLIERVIRLIHRQGGPSRSTSPTDVGYVSPTKHTSVKPPDKRR